MSMPSEMWKPYADVANEVRVEVEKLLADPAMTVDMLHVAMVGGAVIATPDDHADRVRVAALAIATMVRERMDAAA